MARFCTLASSSAGNSTYISAANSGILVDAGVSCRRITTALKAIDCNPKNIASVLITHEHSDHIKGLKLFLKTSGASVCATAPVLEYLICHGYVEAGTLLIEVGSTPFLVGGMEVCAFPTPHDSVGSVGYRITTPDYHSVAVATDMGEVTQQVLGGVTGCELVLLEANYDPQLLKMGDYPYFLKQRISSSVGHLPNEQSGELAARLIKNGTTKLILAHLSRENNNPSLANITVADALAAVGATRDRDYTLSVAPYDSPCEMVYLA